MNSIYQAQVPVSSQSVEEKNKMLPEALSQVLVKVSGKTSILENTYLTGQLNQPAELMQEYGYLPANKANTLAPYLLKVTFDQEGVNKLLRDAKAPVWGIDRPLILAWIELEVPNQPAEIIDSNSEGDIQVVLKDRANLRGIPIMLPMMDVTDLNLVSVNDIVMMTIPTLQTASKRYASDGMLIARLLHMTDGYSLQAKLVLGADQWDWTLKAASISEVLNMLVNNIADTLAGRYSSFLTNVVQTHLTLKIIGVTQQDDFANLMRYISHMTTVANVVPAKIDGDTVSLNISLRGAQDAFMQAIALDKKITPVSDVQEKGSVLLYQWNH